MTAERLGTWCRGLIRTPRGTVRLVGVVFGGVMMATALPAAVDVQDVAQLAGSTGDARWKSFVARTRDDGEPLFFASSKAEAMALPPHASRLLGINVFHVAEAPAPLPTPDEMRILRSGKGARVRPEVSANQLPPRGFSAGSILERQSLLGPRVVGGAERIRTAFSKVTQTTKEALTVAANFKLMGPPKLTDDDDAVMLASLKPSVAGTSALGYASREGSSRTSSLFEQILKQEGEAFVPPITEDDHAWAASILPKSAFGTKEQTCLANGIYFEARGESVMGQAAVAQVILNRVRNPAFPNSICGVVYQNKNWRNRCQFSFACDGSKDRIADRKAYTRAKRVAEQVTKGEIWINAVGSATHYHANYVRPRWAGAMERVDRIGKHIFYRTYNGGW